MLLYAHFQDFKFIFNYVYGGCECGYVKVLQRLEECIGSSEAGVADSDELPVMGCWEPYLGPLQEQSALLTTEPSR